MYLEKLRLDGRVAIVTGGGRNIGLACGQALAEAGATVVVADLSAELAAEGAAEIARAGGRSDSVVIDVTDSASVDAATDQVARRHGSLDVLVCNAGIAISEVKAEDTSDEHWLKHIDINLNGVFRCCRSAGRIMLGQGRGAIVNIGSMSGFIVNKPQEQSFYNASKAGVHHLTRSLAAEWAPRGIRVNAVAPTYIDTTLTRFGMENPKLFPHWVAGTPMGRVGQPDEVASAVQFLASDAASLITGAILQTDGGYTLW